MDFDKVFVMEETKHLAIDKMLYHAIKRITDVLCSLIGMVFLLPMIFIVKISCMLHGDFTTIFFKHKRIGKNGKEIYLYKFRSMVPNAEELIKKFTPEQKKEFAENFKLENDPRITKMGGFLRKTSLDELPQLINILKGDMALIGPRPVVEVELEKYGSEKDKFLSVTPGLTGYWACNGRSDTTYEERIEMELYYVDHLSFKLDIKIFFKTIISVVKKDGAK